MIRLSTKYINNYIDMTTTGNKYADRFLDISQKDYLRKTRNSVSEIKLMSPDEYFYWCSIGFGTDEARQYEVVANDSDSLNHQLDMIHNGERLKLPYLNFSTFNGFGQDGRHRVYALKELGVEYLPVLWICDADSESYDDMDEISESYLDDDQKFYDYHTGSVSGSDIFDTHKTGYSYYDNFLNDPDYMRKSKGKVGKIVMLTPEEYFQACADGFKVPYSQQIASTKADDDLIDHLKQVILQYKRKFPLTYLSKTSSDGFQQEGRHRMYVAGELVGWNTKFPVLIVRDA